MSQSPLDRSQPPLPGTPAPFSLPAFTRHTLGNGLQLLVAPLPHAPLVNLSIVLPAGGQFAPTACPGLPSFHAALLDEGTSTRNALEIALEVEQLGGALATGVDWDVAALHLATLARNLDAGVDLLADLTLDPVFAPEEIERQRRERRASILRRQQQPAFLASSAFAEAVYRGTRYAEPLFGTANALTRLDRDTVQQFFRDHVVPSSATVVVTGDVDTDVVCARLERTLGSALAGTPPERPSIEAPPPKPGILIIDRPGAEQTQLVMGHASVPRSHPDHPARTVANAILGGSFTSRINLNLREKHGLTYGANSRLAARHGPGPFIIRAAVTTEGTGKAVSEVRREIERLRTEPVPTGELRDVQRYLIGLFAYSLQTIEQIGHRLEALAVHNLSDDYYETFPHSLGDVSAEAVLDAARRFMRPDELTIVAVGPEETLRPQLEPLGPVEVTPAPA